MDDLRRSCTAQSRTRQTRQSEPVADGFQIRTSATAAICAIVLLLGCTGPASDEGAHQAAPDPARENETGGERDGLQAEMLSAAQVTAERIDAARNRGANAIVLEVRGGSDEEIAAERKAAETIAESGLALWCWIEIARHPALADAEPLWMASLQGHGEWRRFFPDAPKPGDGEVVKVYPWVPILYREAFDAHLARVEKLLSELPQAKGILLNDVQGAPSACGCGHPLCRWTADYGPIKTATPLECNAAAQFVAAVAQLAPDAEIVPVWTTECEKHDGAADGLCAGVGCYDGLCWKEYTAQLTPLADEADRVGVLLAYRDFHRDLARYGPEGGWIRQAIRSFETEPKRFGASGVKPDRLIAVVQGWDMEAEQVDAQVKMARESGAAGYVVSYVKIEQTWEPRIVNYAPPEK